MLGNGKRNVILGMISTGEGSGKIKGGGEMEEFVMLLKESKILSGGVKASYPDCKWKTETWIKEGIKHVGG